MSEKRNGITRIARTGYHKAMTDRFGLKYLQYRKDWEAASAGQYLPSFPIQIDFDVIDYCNLKCIMCTRSTKRGTRTQLALSSFKRVIDEGAAHGLSAVEFGIRGEPLLHPDLPDMVAYASAKGIMDIRTHTNATVLVGDLASRLIGNGLTRISFSLDACYPETYRLIRGADLDKVERNIMSFLDILRAGGHSLPVTGVSLVELPQNAHEVQDFIAKWVEVVDSIDIVGCADIADLSKEVVITNTDVEGFRCYLPWPRLTVAVNGDINPCCTFRGQQIVLGNIRELSIVDAWSSPTMATFRQSLVDKHPPQICLTCFACRAKVQPLAETVEAA